MSTDAPMQSRENMNSAFDDDYGVEELFVSLCRAHGVDFTRSLYLFSKTPSDRSYLSRHLSRLLQSTL